MDKNLLLILLTSTMISCGSYKPKKPFTTEIFLGLENVKCEKNGIEKYLLSSEYFRSNGTSPNSFGEPAQLFQTFYKYRKKFIFVRLSSNIKQFIFNSYKPDAYNYIKKNGKLEGTVSPGNSRETNLIYTLNGSKYFLNIDETIISGKAMRSYTIISTCY